MPGIAHLAVLRGVRASQAVLQLMPSKLGEPSGELASAYLSIQSPCFQVQVAKDVACALAYLHGGQPRAGCSGSVGEHSSPGCDIVRCSIATLSSTTCFWTPRAGPSWQTLAQGPSCGELPREMCLSCLAFSIGCNVRLCHGVAAGLCAIRHGWCSYSARKIWAASSGSQCEARVAQAGFQCPRFSRTRMLTEAAEAPGNVAQDGASTVQCGHVGRSLHASCLTCPFSWHGPSLAFT